jgi:hypothetical protein
MKEIKQLPQKDLESYISSGTDCDAFPNGTAAMRQMMVAN